MEQVFLTTHNERHIQLNGFHVVCSRDSSLQHVTELQLLLLPFFKHE